MHWLSLAIRVAELCTVSSSRLRSSEWNCLLNYFAALSSAFRTVPPMLSHSITLDCTTRQSALALRLRRARARSTTLTRYVAESVNVTRRSNYLCDIIERADIQHSSNDINLRAETKSDCRADLTFVNSYFDVRRNETTQCSRRNLFWVSAAPSFCVWM